MHSNVEETRAIDTSACDREPIHIPGSIQPHGVLLTVDEATGRIRHVAGDCDSLIGFQGEPIGHHVQDVLGRSLPDLVEDYDLDLVHEPLFVGTYQGQLGRAELDILIHRKDGFLIVELEPALAARPSASRLFARMRDSADRMRAAETADAAFDVAAAEIRLVTGFDRVLIYHFLDDGSGEVVGERRADPMRPFLGHRFPVGDIPQQARALYLRNHIRVIPDVGYTPATLRGEGNLALDMSDCSLRSVSPVHIQYLKNMGVTASMSVSLLKDGRLWGLIACHHKEPLLVPYETREACKHVAEDLMRQLAAIEARQLHERHLHLSREIDRLTNRLSHAGDVGKALADAMPLIARMFLADGAVVHVAGRHHLHGDLPNGLSPDRLMGALNARSANSLYVSNDMESEDPGNIWREGVEGGLLFVTTHDAEPIEMAFFRRRVTEMVRWAGNPDKAVQVDAATGAINPRKSFEAWQETTRGLPLAWSQVELEAALRFKALTERLARQKRISLLQSELIHVSRVSAMGAMASTLAHELNQPLTAIANFSKGVGNILQTQGGNGISSALGYLEETSQAAIRAGLIVKRLRAMVSKAPVQQSVVSLKMAVDDSLAIALPDAHVRGIQVALDLDPCCDKLIGDTIQIEQVFTNLLRNAAEAMEGVSEARLQISSRPVSDFLVEVSVSDNGEGVPADLQDKLFSPFNTTKADGMGLGLSICRTIVESHGGRIWMEAGASGTAFKFTLPTAERAET